MAIASFGLSLKKIFELTKTLGFNKEFTDKFNERFRQVDANNDEFVSREEVLKNQEHHNLIILVDKWLEQEGVDLSSQPGNTARYQFENISKSDSNIEEIAQDQFGLSLSGLSSLSKERYQKLKKLAEQTAKEIDPSTTNWYEVLERIEENKYQSPEELMQGFKKNTKEAMKYLQSKGWLGEFESPEILEDTVTLDKTAYVQDGRFYIASANLDSDAYYKKLTKAISIHELVHAADHQKFLVNNNPMAEGIAKFIEEKVIEEDDFYSPEEKLLAIKAVMLRDARNFLIADIQSKVISKEEAIEYLLQEKIVGSEEAANKYVERISSERGEDLLQSISYATGSILIAKLWNKVQEKDPDISFEEFTQKLLSRGKLDDGRIHKIGEELFGVKLINES